MNHKKQTIFSKRILQTIIFFGLLFCVTNSAQAQTPSIIQHFDCIEPTYSNGEQTAVFKAYFGYTNTTTGTITIQQGLNNFLLPPSAQNRPTSVFLPGRHEKSFSAVFTYPNNLTWFLNNTSVTAYVNPANFCGAGTMNYQGRLSNANAAANGNYNLTFKFYETETGGTAFPKTIALTDVPVTNGLFSVRLDVASIFQNNFKINFFEITVQKSDLSDPPTVLAPRQPINAVPYALNAKSVSGGTVQIPQAGSTAASDCDEKTEVGKMFISGVNLYVCTESGWKFTTLQ
ncbi:MAG TPA: hypothetical protein PKY59_17235 [Pyrinomonadaceae bacterium]|nr:hypothetical protein [Pyrinomonadaceae bacterium]